MPPLAGLGVVVSAQRQAREPQREESYKKRELNQNLSGNEVYYTACSLLVHSTPLLERF